MTGMEGMNFDSPPRAVSLYTSSANPFPLYASRSLVADGAAVQKVGRITGFTAGNTDGLSEANFGGGAPSSLEVTAVNLISGFAENGDSGAWILNEQGQVLGMIIGGYEKGFTAFYTPIILMLEDMEKLTGLKLDVMAALKKGDFFLKFLLHFFRFYVGLLRAGLLQGTLDSASFYPLPLPSPSCPPATLYHFSENTA